MTKNKHFGSVAAGALGGALVTGIVLTNGFARAPISADTFRQLDLFGEVFEQVHANYVEAPEDADLIHGAIDGMLDELDPHSSFLAADDYERMQEQTRGSFAGLGIQIVEEKGFVKVVSPIDDTPAQRAGIVTNDLIVEIDGADVFPMSLDEAISKLKGPKGTSVTIKVKRGEDADPFKLTLVRDIVRVEAVTSRAEGDFGYIRIRTFSETAAEGLRKSIKKVDKEIPGGAKGYVLDLRANPGGLLDQAVAVSDVFLEGGEIVSTRGRNPKDTLREMGTRGDLTNGKPIVVLINGGSASASEIVAGALQDRNRAVLLGTKTFGKGSVQTVIPLQNGLQGALRLTTARYYTPAGRSIQATGIEPDIAMPLIFPGQEEPFETNSEADLDGALDVREEEKTANNDDPETANPADVLATDEESTVGDTSGVEPVFCPYENEETKTVKDCQLERALELLADTTAFRAALADAGSIER
ncbi:MAG: S41 family peptidase [Pseudomonadota bacterium]